MTTLKRFTAVLIALLIMLPCTVSGTELPDYIPDEYYDYIDGIVNAAENCKPSYKFGEDGISAEWLGVIMNIVLNEYPELFHLAGAYQYTMPMGNPDIALSVLLKYKMTADEYAAARNEVNSWVEKVVSLTDPSFTEYEYALFFHDYLASFYDYDTSYQVRDVYSFIKEGVGVCQAYTYAYMLLLDTVGVECSYASSAEMNHIWNLVKLDGEWYHVDVTWDDPLGSVPGKAGHKHFLYSDNGFLNMEEPHIGWVSLHECSSDKYDGHAVTDTDSSFAYLDGKWYYIKGTGLFVTDSPDSEGVEVVPLDGMRWNVWDSSAFYTSVYSGIIAKDGLIYVSTSDSIVEINPTTKDKNTVFSYSGNDGYIYGFLPDMGDDGISGAALGSGKIILNIAKKPGGDSTKLTVKLDGSGVEGRPGDGDANGDGRINLADVTLMLKYIAKWDVEINLTGADFDLSGSVNLSDVTGVMKRIAGWNI